MLTSNSCRNQQLKLRHLMPTSALKNQLLAGLPAPSFERLRPDLALISLAPGHVLFKDCAAQTDVYFPVTTVVTLSSFRPDGTLIRLSRIGDDGVVGIPHFLIGKVAPCSGIVQTGGFAYRLPSQCLVQEFNRGGPALRMFLRYAKILMTQMEQTAICHTSASLALDDCAKCGHAKGCALP